VPVRESAFRLKAALDDINAKAMAIVEADHEHIVRDQYTSENPTPGIPKLKELTQDREKAIAAETINK
jgi:hypothetical protein